MNSCPWTSAPSDGPTISLTFVKVPAGILPEILPSAGEFGRTRGLSYLPDGLPITGVAGDQQASLVGQGCLESGQAKCTYGTGAFLLAHTGGRVIPSTRGLVTTLAATLGNGPPQYALEGSVFVAGAAVHAGRRDGPAGVGAAFEIDAMSSMWLTPRPSVLFVPALTGLGAPHWEPDARGTIFGLTRATTIADLARATLEGVAFQVADLIDAINADLDHPLADLRVDGGMARSDPFLQFQSDLLDLTLQRSPQPESTAAGRPALLADAPAPASWPDPLHGRRLLLQSGFHAFSLSRRDAARRSSTSPAMAARRRYRPPAPSPSRAPIAGPCGARNCVQAPGSMSAVSQFGSFGEIAERPEPRDGPHKTG